MDNLNLMDGINNEIDRVEDIIRVYDKIPEGSIAAEFMRHAVTQARKARKKVDLPDMIYWYNELKGYDY